MQDMDFSQCTTTPMTVYDKRDMQEYTVAKLADGNCWMAKNLNLAGGTALSASDTDVESSYISSFSTSNNLTKSGSTIVLPASSQSGFTRHDYSYVYNSSSTNCSSTPGCYGYYSNVGPGTTPNFLLGGLYYSGAFDDIGYGYYWSATSFSSTTNAHYFYFTPSSVYSASNNNRRTGASIRCVRST